MSGVCTGTDAGMSGTASIPEGNFGGSSGGGHSSFGHAKSIWTFAKVLQASPMDVMELVVAGRT